MNATQPTDTAAIERREHTALPWKAYKGGPGDDNWFVAQDSGDGVAKYGTAITGWGRVQQSRADAELIAEAVNSHAALEAERDALREAASSALSFFEQYKERHIVPADFYGALAELRKVLKGESNGGRSNSTSE